MYLVIIADLHIIDTNTQISYINIIYSQVITISEPLN